MDKAENRGSRNWTTVLVEPRGLGRKMKIGDLKKKRYRRIYIFQISTTRSGKYQQCQVALKAKDG